MKYHVETADRWFYVDVFYNEEGEFVAKEVGGTEQLVLSVGPANWEAV